MPKQVMMIYVMSPDGTLYINDKKRLRFHHSSFLAGAQLDPTLIPHPSSLLPPPSPPPPPRPPPLAPPALPSILRAEPNPRACHCRVICRRIDRGCGG